MNITNSLLQIGARCEISACLYEVSFVGKEGIRLTPQLGGPQQYLAFESLNELIEDDAIKIKYTPNPDDKQMFSGLTDEQVEALQRKLTYVKGVCGQHSNPRSQKAIATTIQTIAQEKCDPKPPSTASVTGWIKKWIESGYQMIALAPKLRPSRASILDLSPELLSIVTKAVKKVYLNRQKNPQSAVMATIRILLADYNSTHTEKLKMPSPGIVRRFINSLDAYEVARQRYGKRYANRKFRAAGIAFFAAEPLEMVMADGQIMDIIIARKLDDGTYEAIGRPFLTALIDVRTRVILGHYISMAPFCSATLLGALADAVVPNGNDPKGIMQKIIIDNGADYLSSAFLKACGRMNIAIESCRPYDPNAKAIIERFFGTLNMDLIHKLPGTTFSNPEDRGDYASQEMACITLDKLREFVDTWIRHTYHVRDHRTLQCTPIDIWNEEVSKVYPNTLSKHDADILLRSTRECTLSQGCVEAHGLQWSSHSLMGWEQEQRRLGKSRKLIVQINELDLSEVYIATKDNPDRFYKALSRTPHYTNGLSLYEHRLLKSELKQKRIKARMVRMKDSELYRLRLEFYAALGHGDDKFAKRKMERLLKYQDSQEPIQDLVGAPDETSDTPPTKGDTQTTESQLSDTAEPLVSGTKQTTNESSAQRSPRFPSTTINKRKPT